MRDAQRQHEAFFGKKERGRDHHTDSRDYQPHPQPQQQPPPSSYYGPSAGGAADEGQEGGGGGQWAWSRGEETQQSKREERQRRKREREAELLRPEAGSAVQQGAVRMQWERRLESQAQGFLQQVG